MPQVLNLHRLFHNQGKSISFVSSLFHNPGKSVLFVSSHVQWDLSKSQRTDLTVSENFLNLFQTSF